MSQITMQRNNRPSRFRLRLRAPISWIWKPKLRPGDTQVCSKISLPFKADRPNIFVSFWLPQRRKKKWNGNDQDGYHDSRLFPHARACPVLCGTAESGGASKRE